MDDSPPNTQHRGSVMYGGNASFVEGLYEDYLRDPTSVSPEWRAYFDGLRDGAHETPHGPVQQAFLELGRRPQLRAAAAATPAPTATPNRGVSALINAYRLYGHLSANFNPLQFRTRPVIPELDPAYYGLTEADLGTQVSDGGFSGTLRDVLAELRATYCGAIGFEFVYLPREEREWFQARVEEGRGRRAFTTDQKKRLLNKLNAAEGLERYLHVTYVGQKRFSLEGGESLIPLLDTLIQHAGPLGVKETVIGMAHRGRLNVLVNIFGKRPADLFAEFEGKKVLSDDPDVAGDVKYHMGFSSDVRTPGGPMHLALAFNPSHLEIVSPVVHGSARARQDRRSDAERAQVLPITIHGDAAIAGQGVVMETVNLSRLRGFTTGGAVRIVVNNQVGFTTSDPRDTRSSRYTTDIAKVVESPAMHVNADDPEAVAFVAQLAAEYRQKFHKDVFIDLLCYRKLGHNESDDPTITQPVMYREVKAHPGTRALYAQKLEKEGVLQPGDADRLVTGFRDLLDQGESVVQEIDNDEQSALAVDWAPFLDNHWRDGTQTGVPVEKLRELGLKLTEIPEGFTLHRNVDRVIKARREMAEGKQLLDWGMGETLAYATLLDEGYNVRLTGQDVGRGTFVHRHAVLHDQNAQDPLDEEFLPLARLREGQGRVEVIDSTLSEEAVVAFEYGYSTAEPNTLVAWEAQFGDFVNVAQVVIDQFISSGESKWRKLSGLTLLLPHGYEHQGPEHSSARLERFLQLCAQHNMQVVVPSTPAQTFHMLRRQLVRPVRKPLIVMTPKSLLRHKLATSSLEELASGQFQTVIGDPVEKARRVVISSGKLHWELFEAREKNGLEAEIALVRLEQLYPFPHDELRAELARHGKVEVVWAQEEPFNQGAWHMIRDDLTGALAKGQTLSVASRKRSASPAVGYAGKSAQEQQAVIETALGLNVAKA